MILGDFNGVANLSVDKFPVKKGGRLLNVYFEMIQQEQMEDVWRIWHEKGKEFTFYYEN